MMYPEHAEYKKGIESCHPALTYPERMVRDLKDMTAKLADTEDKLATNKATFIVCLIYVFGAGFIAGVEVIKWKYGVGR